MARPIALTVSVEEVEVPEPPDPDLETLKLENRALRAAEYETRSAQALLRATKAEARGANKLLRKENRRLRARNAELEGRQAGLERELGRAQDTAGILKTLLRTTKAEVRSASRLLRKATQRVGTTAREAGLERELKRAQDTVIVLKTLRAEERRTQWVLVAELQRELEATSGRHAEIRAVLARDSTCPRCDGLVGDAPDPA